MLKSQFFIMSLMSEMSKDNFIHRNYIHSSDIFERKIKAPNLNLYLGYADTPPKCGKVLEALELYDDNCGVGDASSAEKLIHVTYGLMESVMTAFGSFPGKPQSNASVYACAICENVLRHPTTINCGHTFCRKCLVKDFSRTCRKCGQKYSGPLETNVLVKRLVEKFWPGEVLAAEIREEGDDHFQRNELEEAVAKYDEALGIVPGDHLSLSARSHALSRMGKYQAALLDAEHVIRIRPLWGKGHQRRGVAMLALGHSEEAFVSFCTYVALERNPQTARHDLCKVLQNILSNNLRSRHITAASTFVNSLQVGFRRAAKYFQHRSLINISPSDFEDHSSGDEDFYESPNSIPTIIRSNFYALINYMFSELEKLKRTNVKLADLSLKPSLVEQSDFECVLCCRTLWKPVTTPCGHTYCQTCLDRSLDYSSACPLCMKSLTDYMSVSPKNVTEFLNKILKTHLPTECLKRRITHQAEISEIMMSCNEKEPQVPVFVCTTGYPSIHCPLFIYEPRYRLMIRQCIEAGTRQFGIAACFTSENGTRRFADFGTILEIKDWVLMSNGCSILSTVGVRRFRTLSRGERDGYETAKVKFLVDEPVPEECLFTLKKLHDEVREKAVSWVKTFNADFKEQIVTSFGTMPEVEEDWSSLPDGPSWTWWLLAILPLGPLLQVSILGTTSLEKRLRAIDKTLNQIRKTLGNHLKALSS